jgi:hypothetical protein
MTSDQNSANNLLSILIERVTQLRQLRQPISTFVGRPLTFTELANSALTADLDQPSLGDLKKIAEIFDRHGASDVQSSREVRRQDAAAINHVLGRIALIPMGCGYNPSLDASEVA